jgi:ADP-heptose:LPS heptosyltransferase
LKTVTSGATSLYERTRDAAKIIVVDLGYLGDTLHLVPALWEIKDHYRRVKLHVLSTRLGCEALSLVPCVDRAWSLELKKGKRTLREHWIVLRALRRERFDLAFNFSGNDRGIILTGLCGARISIAHSAGRSHFWNSWLVNHWVSRRPTTLRVFEQRRQVLAACGLKPGPPRFVLQANEADAKWAAGVLPAGGVHLSINSGNPFKELPLEFHVLLLKTIWASLPKLQVWASAGPQERERERLQKLVEMVKDNRLQLLPENLNLSRLAAALVRCRLHVGPDSGVMHMAAAMGIPTISFFREQKGFENWLPFGEGHHVFSVPCTCIDHHEAPCERLGHAACLAALDPTSVAKTILERLSS